MFTSYHEHIESVIYLVIKNHYSIIIYKKIIKKNAKYYEYEKVEHTLYKISLIKLIFIYYFLSLNFKDEICVYNLYIYSNSIYNMLIY